MRGFLRKSTLSSLCTVLLLGCGAQQQLASGAAVPDSVAYACTPVLVPGPDQEGLIEHFAPGPDGLMAWTTTGAAAMIGSAMDSAVQVGRAGEGPGEFTFIDQIGWSGDTVWATDPVLERVQYFDREGHLLSGHRIPAGGGWRRTPDGRFLAIGTKPAQASGWDLLRMAGDSTTPVADSVYHFPGPEPVVIRRPVTGGVTVPMPDPFLPTARAAAASDASHFCSSEPLDDDATRIRCVDDRGSVTFDSVLVLDPNPLTDATWNQVIHFYTSRDSTYRPALEALFTRPASLPRVTDLQVDRDGALWLNRSWRSDSVQHWLRLTAAGALRDTLVVTHGLIAALSGDTLWRKSSDEDGLQSIERCVARTVR